MRPVFSWYGITHTNFGDELNEFVCSKIMGRDVPITRSIDDSPKLVAIGSVIAWATKPGDCVWGSGTWGGDVPQGLDIRAVRGPITAEAVTRSGYTTPTVMGDPALLMPMFIEPCRGTHRVGLVPHLSDEWNHDDCIDPRDDPLQVVKKIASCDWVVCGSLHGIIVADAYDIPAVLAQSNEFIGHPLKYADYYASTGRDVPKPIPWREATICDVAPKPKLPDLSRLYDAFPRDFVMG